MFWLSLLACTPEPPLPCEGLDTDGPAPTDEAGLRAIAEEVRPLHPALEGLSIDLEPFESEQDFFRSNVDLSTVSDPPAERRYVLEYNPRLFEDPPPASAFQAILLHELQHTVDFAAMPSDELIRFGIWYATTDDFSAYERQTDEAVLRLGCGSGLAEYREWLYAHVDAETVEQKRRDYYTPEEIAAWTDDRR